MDSKEIIILGAGMYGEVIHELSEACGYKTIAFYDDDPGKWNKSLKDTPIIGAIDFSAIEVLKKNFAVAIGVNTIRTGFLRKVRAMGGNTPTLIHPRALQSKHATVGQGCYIHANVYLWTNVVINDDCILSPGVIVGHHAVIEEGSFVSFGSNVGAGVRAMAGSLIGVGSTIKSGVKSIGRRAVIGAGSVVINSVPDDAVVAGVPAKEIKKHKT